MPSLAVVSSRALVGVQAPDVIVECHLSPGLPSLTLVGLPDKAVKESQYRVRSALLSSCFEFPRYRITVNLAPADLPKESGIFDLPIAVSVLSASEQLNCRELDHYELVGELALSGELRPIRGILPIAMAAKKQGKTLILPMGNAEEASLVEGLSFVPISHLTQVVGFLNGVIPKPEFERHSTVIQENHADLQEVIGQQHVKRAMEIAAAGGHSLLMVGPPGTGKTMLASRFTSILPPMSNAEALESAAVLSVSHLGFDYSRWQQHPFRSPHHSASTVALVGGGNPPKPGEISLAHKGILFLDELLEFSRPVLEALREPLESGSITISRAARQCQFPANFQLIAAMNPCPCGYLGDKKQACYCTPAQIQRYHNKLSGPFLDRIDLFVQVPRVEVLELTNQQLTGIESSATVQQRVVNAREKQLKQVGTINARLASQTLKEICQLESQEQALLEKVIKKMDLSARAFYRALKVARTIADLAGEPKVQTTHITEALSYRYALNAF